MAFDVTAARAAGYSDKEIAEHLAAQSNFRIDQARKAGYSDAEIIGHLEPTAAAGSPQTLTPSGTANIAVHQARLKKAQADLQEEQARSDYLHSPLGKYAELNKGMTIGTLDTGQNLIRGLVAAPVAGIAGAVASPFVGNSKAADIVEGTQQFIQGQPYSEVGQGAQQMYTRPISAFVAGADKAGQAVTDVTGSPALGTAVTTGIQAAPAFLAPETRGAFASAGRGLISRIGARSAAPGAGAAAGAQATSAAIDPAAVAKAQSYAQSAGLDWNALSDPIRQRLSEIAATGTDMSQLDAAAIAREARLGSLPVPVPATRGQLAGNRVAIRNEGNAAATTAGQPIADIHIAANQALLDNLDVLKGKVSGTGATAATATTPEQAGAVVQGALRKGEAVSKANYRQLYDTAENAAPGATVSAQPFYDLLENNPDVQHLGFVQSWLKRGKVTTSESTGGVTVDTQRPISLQELQDLKSQATEIARTGGQEGYYAGKVADAARQAIMEHPDAAAAYNAADAAFKAHKIKYEDQGAVSDLVSNASRTDRTTALSNTVKAVTSGAPEEIRQIKATLLTDPDPAVRTAGRAAWREVRAQVIQQIKDRATQGVGVVEGGAPNLTPSGLNNAIAAFGPEKLDEIFGPGTTRQLQNILQAAKDVKVIPSTGGGSVGSSTVQNALAFLEKGLITATSKIPIVGKMASGAMQAASDIGAAARTTKTATTTPLTAALAKANAKAARADALRKAAGALKTAPLSELGRQSPQ